ncbi:hypothetical protein D3C81_2328300 [compost metagenome]
MQYGKLMQKDPSGYQQHRDRPDDGKRLDHFGKGADQQPSDLVEHPAFLLSQHH